MLSESVVRREESPSFLLFSGRTFPPFFPKKEKKEKTGASESVITEEGVSCQWKREREKRKKRKKGILLSAGLPSLGKERREKAGVSILWSGFSLLQKKGNASRCGIRKRRKGKPSPAHRRESPLVFLSEKRKEEKRSTVLSLLPSPFFFACSLFCTLLKEGKRHHIDMQDAAKDARMRKRKKEGRRLQRGRDRNRGCTSPISEGTTAIRRNSNTSLDIGTIREGTGTS